MKKFTLILAAAILLSLTSCSTLQATLSSSSPSEIDTSSVSEAIELTAEEIAEKASAMMGELNKSYTVPPSRGINIVSVTRHNEFAVDDKTLNDVIVVEIYSTEDVVKAFWKDYGTVELFNTAGETDTMINTTIYYDSESENVFLLFTGDNDISGYQYIAIGGLESGKYEKQKIMFEIK